MSSSPLDCYPFIRLGSICDAAFVYLIAGRTGHIDSTQRNSTLPPNPQLNHYARKNFLMDREPFFFLSSFGKNKTAHMGVDNNFIVSRLTSPDVFWRIWIVFS